MFDFFSKLFGREKSGSVAKERLQLVLIHDRNDISSEMLENIKVDMVMMLKKHLDIDESGIEMQLDKQSRSVALVASIPIKNIKRPVRRQIPKEQQLVKAQPAKGQKTRGQKKKNA